jgi:TetR/AcrR family transcriptional regulator, tetracycline repressor protein
MIEPEVAMTVRQRGTLSRDAVLDAALGLADEGGLGAVSMRRLAARLGVEAMSLYNHVSGKADLLDGIASRVFETIAVPDAALAWDERVRLLIRGCYQAMRAHPAVVQSLVAEAANPRSAGALSVIDAILGALFDAGLDEPEAARGYRSLLGLVFGSVLVETADPAVAAVPDSERAEPIADLFARMATPARLPHLYRALPSLLAADCAADFSHQLELLIQGLRAGTPAGRGGLER